MQAESSRKADVTVTSTVLQVAPRILHEAIRNEIWIQRGFRSEFVWSALTTYHDAAQLTV